MQKQQSQWIVKYRSRSNIDDCIWEAMLRYLQVPSITAVGPQDMVNLDPRGMIGRIYAGDH